MRRPNQESDIPTQALSGRPYDSWFAQPMLAAAHLLMAASVPQSYSRVRKCLWMNHLCGVRANFSGPRPGCRSRISLERLHLPDICLEGRSISRTTVTNSRIVASWSGVPMRDDIDLLRDSAVRLPHRRKVTNSRDVPIGGAGWSVRPPLLPPTPAHHARSD